MAQTYILSYSGFYLKDKTESNHFFVTTDVIPCKWRHYAFDEDKLFPTIIITCLIDGEYMFYSSPATVCDLSGELVFDKSGTILGIDPSESVLNPNIVCMKKDDKKLLYPHIYPQEIYVYKVIKNRHHHH